VMNVIRLQVTVVNERRKEKTWEFDKVTFQGLLCATSFNVPIIAAATISHRTEDISGSHLEVCLLLSLGWPRSQPSPQAGSSSQRSSSPCSPTRCSSTTRPRSRCTPRCRRSSPPSLTGAYGVGMVGLWDAGVSSLKTICNLSPDKEWDRDVQQGMPRMRLACIVTGVRRSSPPFPLPQQ
jgi:hypothetical protein